MRTFLQLIIIAFSAFKMSAQCFTFTIITTAPSCPSCCDGTANVSNLSGGCPPYTYSWSNGNTGPNDMTFCYDNTYSVTIQDAGSCCPDTIASARISSTTTGISNIQDKNSNFSVSPNPTTSIINIFDEENQFQNSTIIIRNYLGQLVFTTPFNSQINLSDLSAGMYFLTIRNGTIKKTVKIVKE